MTAAPLDDLAAQHLGRPQGDYRHPCPICRKPGLDDAASITVEDDGHVVANCYRCHETGTAYPKNGAKQPAARFRPTAAQEDHTALWESGTDPGETCEHPYLIRKGVQPHGIHVVGDLLLVPMRDAAGDLVGVQKIKPDSTKRNTRGAKKTGAYHAIGIPDGRIVIAEGYATGSSIFEATGCAVAVGFDADNMIHVAKALRAKFPDIRIVIASDDDIQTKGNPGLTAATAAAKAVNGVLAVPDFGEDRPDHVSDFNDLCCHRGPEAVAACINAAKPVTDPVQADDGLEITCADDLEVERVRWLWAGYLPRGKLTLIAGPAGVSKTTLTLAIAATITQGGRWPDGTRADVGSVLIWSGEDGIADTLLPRLIAHGANRSHVHFVGEIVENGKRHAFDPSIDMDRLLLTALRIDDLRLVMIDPVILTVRGDSNTNGDVRRGLYPLQQLAERTGAAVIGITHFSKGTSGKAPVERVTGSLAFAAAARVVLAVARMPEDQGGGRLVVRAKNNLGPDDGGFRFDLRTVDVAGAETVSVVWGEAVTGSALDVLATAEARDDPEDHDAISEATEWLSEVLQDAGGSMERKEVLVAAKAAGHYERRVDRAKARLRLTVATTGFGKARRSIWTLVRP